MLYKLFGYKHSMAKKSQSEESVKTCNVISHSQRI